MFDFTIFTICNLIYNFFNRAKKANRYEKKKSGETTFTKIVIGIDINDIGNLEDLLKVVFIDEKCGNLNLNAGELTRNINQKKKLDVLQDLQFVKNAAGEGISSISKWDIANQLRKYDFSCD